MTIRSTRKGLSWTALATILAITPAWAQDAADTTDDDTPSARRGVETMTVTAQRTEESLLDVPIAVSAFSEEDLALRQIDNISDLQFNTPNVTFTKGNFAGSNLQIRGIGSTLVATSADTGVGVHVNNVYLLAPRIFELEYFDVERVEVLRGPQGTLYGRNSTGGAVNIITARPVLDEFSASVDAQFGNFAHRRIKGHVNVPLIENTLGVRFSGIYLERDGYSENIFNGDDIDGRDQYAFRGSLRWTPTETTTIDLIGSYFKDNSDRVRSAKQLCNRDESAVLGCLPDKLENETTNASATLAGLLSSDLVLGPLGLFSFFGSPGGNANAINPSDLRTVNIDFQPIYEADETFIMGSVQQVLFDGKLTATVEAAYQDTSVFSQQDYNSIFSGDVTEVPAALAQAFPATFAALYADGQFPLSDIDPGNAGIIGGAIRDRSNVLEGYDQSDSQTEQYSVELRLQSDLEGPFNFLLGGYYLDAESSSNYYVVASQLDYFAVLAAGFDGIGLASPYFNNTTDLYELTSYAAYGEVYYDFTETFSVTGGIRYTIDEKSVQDRQYLFNAPVPLGTENANPIIDTTFDFDPATPGQQPVREQDVDFREITGRFVAEWTPEVSFTDATNIYASYSRGYKSGGINPAIDPSLFPDTEVDFEPEFINAFEIGTKNELLDSRLQANLTAFYYDYSGLQVSKIVNRTSVNENIDAIVWGVEGEFLFSPVDPVLFNLNVSYLNTEIQDSDSVDGRDPTDGSADVTLIKDISNASNCVVNHNGAGDLVSSGAATALNEAGIPFIPTQTEGIAFAGFGICDALAAGFAGLDLPYTVSGGVSADLDGNELQNSPDVTVSFGAQHVYDFNARGADLSLVSRVDFYWQSSMFARTFNRPIDEIDAWSQTNLSVTLYGPEDAWFLRGFVTNVFDNDNITGHYFTDPSSGNFTNVFVLEPRLYGVNLGYTF